MTPQTVESHSKHLKAARCWVSFGILLGSLLLSRAADLPAYYKTLTLPVPDGVVLEAGSMQWLGDDTLAVSTRLGDIYLVENALAERPSDVRFQQYASGLHEVLGMALKDDWLYCVQRCELTRMKDEDHDGRADVFETVNDDWGITGDYHEYAFSSKFDGEGNIWIVLCLTGSFTSETDYRGWCLRVTPEGKMIPTCSGIRSPGGIGMNALGDVFYTDNQGVWNGTCGLKHLKPGGFMGNPTGNRWYTKTDTLGPRPLDPVSGSRMHFEASKIPELVPTAVYFPYQKMGQSASGIVCDETRGKFGPFEGQMLVCDQTHSTVMRVDLEMVNGVYQGACYPFLKGYDSGNLSLEFAPDGSLFVGGTDRGWGARGGKPFALQRTLWMGETPFEVHTMRARMDGFELSFTKPVDFETASDPASYTIETYTYIYQSGYGSPEVDQTTPRIQSVTVSQDGLRARIKLDHLQVGHVHELKLQGIRSKAGNPLWNPSAYYTLNQIPKDLL
ncbi:MAG: hypothetical protein P8L18_11765 [Verrucomicrobiota bacterium]|jgi:hypothetical protein|nr:hypothetical protein [Verrucomicrobiota bacterium]MDG1891977.1 hypothetical protein [Verrucomicrobiota bacterium]